MRKHSLRDFNPDQMAQLDTAMWQAYYGHRFLRLTLLLVRLMRSQFRFNSLQATKAAYYSGRAATSFRRNRQTQADHSDAQRDLEALYEYVRKHVQDGFDPKEVARLELRWWLIHRRPKGYQEKLNSALAAAMGALYDVDPAKLQTYARNRAKAMRLRDVATWQTHTEPDWKKIETLLRTAYQSLHEQLHTQKK